MDKFLKISEKDKIAAFVKAETEKGLSEDWKEIIELIKEFELEFNK